MIAFEPSKYASTWMIYNDRPHHTRLRGQINRAFWVSEIEAVRPEIRRIVSAEIERLVADGAKTAFDFVEDIAHPIPALVLCRMLGIPEDKIGAFIGWSDDISAFMQDFVVSPVPDAAISEQTRGSMREMFDYLAGIIGERRANPQNDLISRLAPQVTEEGAELDDREIIAQVIRLIFGGHKVPQFLLSNCLHLLFSHPDVLDEVRRDPERIAEVVEEACAWRGPSSTSPGTRARTSSCTGAPSR
ncbi:cytochrome P450 [Streptomyces sp. ISL-43]|uniref:cytochrome P450 n=1 Tax=Streptomyces sp. ISL-43 TaxID=2819183 RepID=UPI001BE7877B|nr:cytochrome P450 [Streptomyces sp. ISL-43]MBT2451988.1 cytochrome P450 [Streptomyces sp. ISL-43]